MPAFDSPSSTHPELKWSCYLISLRGGQSQVSEAQAGHAIAHGPFIQWPSLELEAVSWWGAACFDNQFSEPGGKQGHPGLAVEVCGTHPAEAL